MKISIPENKNEITLGQYQKYMSLMREDSTESEIVDNLCIAFLGIDNIDGVSLKDKNRLAGKVAEALDTEGIASDKITLNGVKYGRIPNFDKVVGGEYGDLTRYGEFDKRDYSLLRLDYENLHRFMCICYRPVKDEDSHGNYSIEPYDSTNNADVMKELPLSFIKECENFFLTLWKDFENHILISMAQEQKAKKRQDTLRNMGFWQRFMSFVTMIILSFSNY